MLRIHTPYMYYYSHCLTLPVWRWLLTLRVQYVSDNSGPYRVVRPLGTFRVKSSGAKLRLHKSNENYWISAWSQSLPIMNSQRHIRQGSNFKPPESVWYARSRYALGYPDVKVNCHTIDQRARKFRKKRWNKTSASSLLHPWTIPILLICYGQR